MIKDFSATLTDKKRLAGDVWGFSFSMQNGETLDFTAGQYVLLKINENFRQYSISSTSLQKDSFDCIVEYFPGGLASTYLSALEVGQDAHFKGPAGVFTLHETPLSKVYLATGTGIAPVKSMIETQLATQIGTRAILFFGLKSQEEMYLSETFKQLNNAHPETFSYIYCLSREPETSQLDEHIFLRGHIQDGLETFWKTTDITSCEYYICGSKPVVEAVKEFVFQKGAHVDKIFFERFTL